MKKVLSLILALAMVLALAACGDSGEANQTPSNTPASQPPASQAPASQPPVSQPPASEPPASQTPASQAPASQTPASQAPASQPPVSQPPASEPPASQPPASEPPVSQPPASQPPVSQPPASEPPASQPPASEPPASQPPASVTPASTTINFGSQTTALEGNWKLAQVKTASGSYAAVSADAITLKVTLEEDPYELVDGEAYIHNRVWNLTAFLSFGLADVKAELEADDIDSYKGSATWEAFTKGKVMADGEWYEQPGPAVVRFKDIDDYGLYLDKVAGVPDSIETTERNMIIAMNSSGQLLLGYSKTHIENEGTAGDWAYCLVFEK